MSTKPEDKCESLVLRSRAGFPMIPMAYRYLRSQPPIKPHTGIVVSRRRFLGTAAIATAGALLIKPAGIEGAPGFFSNLIGIVEKFAGGILLNALNYGANLTGPFGALLSQTEQILTGYSPQGGVYGDESSNALGRYLLGLGNKNELNAAGAVANEARDRLRGIFQGPSLMGLGTMLGMSAIQDLMKTKKGQKTKTFVQKYLLPNVVNNTNPIAIQAGGTMLAPNQSFARNYKLPQFYPSDSGALVLINYEADSAKNSKSGATRGRGESTIYMVPPEDVPTITKFVKKTPQFWSDADARADLMNGLDGLAENQVKKYPFEFESAS